MGDARAATIFSFLLRARSAGRCWSTGAGAGAWPGGGARASAGAAPPSSPPIVFCWREVEVARELRVRFCDVCFRALLEQEWVLNSGMSPCGWQDWSKIIKCPKNRGSREDGRRRRRESSSERRERRSKKRHGACLAPFEVFVLALAGQDFFAQPTGHCRNVPVLSQGQRVKDELGMRQGGEGGDLPASVCAMISTPGSARGHEGKEPAVRSFRVCGGRLEDRTLSGHEGLKSEGLQEKFDVWSFVWSLVDPPRPLSASSRLAASRLLANPQSAE